jgi:hypothetical protein
VTVTAAAPVSVTVSVTVFVPFATTAVVEGVRLIDGPLGGGAWPLSLLLLHAATDATANAAASFQIRAFMFGNPPRACDDPVGPSSHRALGGQVASFTDSAGTATRWEQRGM